MQNTMTFYIISSKCNGMDSFTWLLVRINDLGKALAIGVMIVLIVAFYVIGYMREKILFPQHSLKPNNFIDLFLHRYKGLNTLCNSKQVLMRGANFNE
ncbi:MAG: hypothetical protein QW369_03235 [Desulfurococcaceae archaeon]